MNFSDLQYNTMMEPLVSIIFVKSTY